MANPQLEDGHVKIANEIAEHLSKLNLSAYQYRVLWVIWRKTYGWHKKSDHISYTQFEELTGINRWHVARALNQLKQKNIITISGNKSNLAYSFQKDWERWNVTEEKSLPKEVTKSLPIEVTESLPKEVTEVENLSLPIQEKSLPKEVTKSLPKEVTTKAKSTIQKQFLTGRRKKISSSDPRVREILTKISEKVGYQIPSYAKEGAAIKRALSMGFSPEQFIACWEKLKTFKFWEGKWLPLAKVTENVGEFVHGRLRDGITKPLPDHARQVREAIQSGED